MGDGVTIDGGYGDFYYREGMSQGLVLIAGGIGITPLMSMIRLIDEASLDVDLTLFYSAATPSEFVFYEELQAIAARHANVRCHFTVTQPGNASWDGRVGRIDRELLGAQAMVPNALYYLSGPRGEDVPSSVELRWRSGEHQAALTSSLCTTGPTGSADSRSSAARSVGRCR